MTQTTKPLTGSRSIREWLDHPAGGPLLRGMLTESGQDEAALKPIEHFAIQQLVELGGGQFPQPLLDQLVRDANGGVAPDVDAAGSDASAEPGPWTRTPLKRKVLWQDGDRHGRGLRHRPGHRIQDLLGKGVLSLL
ncbi:hypothetical protein [Arthrobacter sp. NA-172]|uniref:hypothetical protein n=1 Tax=Arthrobacter sp. NA-172 TaxID=3367524 RepID=UPI003754D8A0